AALYLCLLIFFFQAEDGIRDRTVTGVQTCAFDLRTFRISCGSARRGNASKKDCIESGLSDGKHSGSLMKASTSALSRLSQSNGVRAGSNAASISFIGSSPAGSDSARRAKPSRMPAPESAKPLLE